MSQRFNNGANPQNNGLKFHFIIQTDKLLIQGLSQKDNLQYVGQIAKNSDVDFQDIQEIINNGQFKILNQTKQYIKIKAGPIRIELLFKPKSQIEELKQTLNTIIENQNKLQSIINSQKSTINSLKLIIQKMQTKNNQNKIIKQLKWNPQFKSPQIIIIQNIVIKTSQKKTYCSEFCLLNVPFPKSFKQKLSWTLKINKLIWIFLGICLKSKILNLKFNSENLKAAETGHGLYMIGSKGRCYSHSDKEFNHVQKSFKFDTGDIIVCEYDGNDGKLRFCKNNADKFEMPIVPPPQGDEYYPCISLHDKDESIELINPQ